MQRLQSDIQLEMNARKEETGTELQGLEMKIMVSFDCSLSATFRSPDECEAENRTNTQDLNSKFTILLGEVRTEIEATKWISTRAFFIARIHRRPLYRTDVCCASRTGRVMTAIVIVVVSVVAYFSAGSSSSKPPTQITSLPSIEELGVKPDPHEEVDAHAAGTAETGGRGWSSFWTGTPAATVPPPVPSAQVGGKRVGEQEE